MNFIRLILVLIMVLSVLCAIIYGKAKGIFVCFIVFILSLLSYNYLSSNVDENDYKNNLHSKQYVEQLTKIQSVSINCINGDDGEDYYLNSDSTIKTFNKFKAGDKVDIFYLTNKYDCNIIIKIEKLH